ncbi:MAG: class I SAM-dependent methyltransferase [Elusimicrobia bacterium]|nr:class I SAM-dependent methyltransferase [Elusimicrobiota bacterium]
MKRRLLAWLACPECSADLRCSSAGAAREELHLARGAGSVIAPGAASSEEELREGELVCAGVGHRFAVRDHVPRFLPQATLKSAVRQTRESFGWEWQRYPGSLDEDRDIFMVETQIPAEGWPGRIVLDAGCGMGRYTLVALQLGAEVVAFDLSDALLRLIPRLGGKERLHLVQGDLLRPPFKPGIFDIAYSQGVLHHTSDTASAFRRTAALVKPGGLLSVWVYGFPGSYRSFSSNPLRSDRTWLRPFLPLVWAVVWARLLVSDFLRLLTVRLPIHLLYAFCFPLAALGAVPFVKYLTFSAHPNFRVRWIENFDWLAPPFQYKHTKEELRRWFDGEGFSVLRQLAHGVVPKVGMLGRRS